MSLIVAKVTKSRAKCQINHTEINNSHRKHRNHRKRYFAQKTIIHTESTEITENISVSRQCLGYTLNSKSMF